MVRFEWAIFVGHVQAHVRNDAGNVKVRPLTLPSPSLSIRSYPLGLYIPPPFGNRRNPCQLRQIAAVKICFMTTITPLEKLTIPLGGQVIELQQLDHDGGGMSLLRTRIREKSRFTVFEIDPLSAQIWGEALLRWARSQPAVQVPDKEPT
jgi:hypothetical protein